MQADRSALGPTTPDPEQPEEDWTLNSEETTEWRRLWDAVDVFAAGMKERLWEMMKKGKRGWADPQWEQEIARALLGDAQHLNDADIEEERQLTEERPLTTRRELLTVDVANRAMMLYVMARARRENRSVQTDGEDQEPTDGGEAAGEVS